MIEHLRKYTGLIIVVVVLVLIGFLFMDTSTMRASQSGAPVLNIAGRNYTDKEYRKLGEASYKLTQSLMQSGDFSLYPFLVTLAGDAQSQDQIVENFFINRILLRSSKEKFGVYPGDEGIDTFIRKLRAFTGPDGAFSQEQYRNFVEKGIGRLGLTEADLRELSSDILSHRKLADILGSGLSTNRDILAKTAALDNQLISVNVARIGIDPIEEKIDPSAEEIKLYWETVQDAFKTPEKRKFTYFIAKPAPTEEPAEIAAPPADATEEAKAEYEKQKAAAAATAAEVRRKAQLAIGEKVDDFLYKLESQKNLSFDDLAKAEGIELKTTELFALADAPAELKATLRASSSQSTAADELFRMHLTSDPFSRISPAIAIGENDYLIARLDETEPVRIQTFDEARDEARARLISDKATAGLKEAAEKATESVRAALAEGKSFDEAAKAAGITDETVSVSDVTSSYQADTTKLPSNLFQAAKYDDPGGMADPVIESDRAFVIQVVSREIVKQEDAEASIQAQIQSAAERNKITAFASWLNAQNDAADVKQLYKQR